MYVVKCIVVVLDENWRRKSTIFNTINSAKWFL